MSGLGLSGFRKCPACQANNAPENRHCRVCGRTLIDVSYSRLRKDKMVISFLVGILVVVLVIILILSPKAGKYVGTWKSEGPFGEVTVVLNSDNTGIISGGLGPPSNLTWQTKDDQLIINDGQEIIVGKLSEDSQRLTLSSEDGSKSVSMIRQSR